MDVIHHIILLHGMGDIHPEDAYYKPFRENIASVLRRRGCDPDQVVRFYSIDYSQIGSVAEKAVLDRSFPELKGQKPCPLHLIPFIRYFLTFYVGDVVVYSSPDGENSIRSYVFDRMDKIIQGDASTFSIVAHSLGSVIAYDYLYNVFGKDSSKCRQVRPDGKHQLHSFFTMGSPIGLFLLRKRELFGRNFALLKPNPIGLKTGTGSWCNFYDRQDVIAFPLKGFFPEIVKDIRVQTGDLIINSHENYWTEKGVAAKIVDRLLAT